MIHDPKKLDEGATRFLDPFPNTKWHDRRMVCSCIVRKDAERNVGRLWRRHKFFVGHKAGLRLEKRVRLVGLSTF